MKIKTLSNIFLAITRKPTIVFVENGDGQQYLMESLLSLNQNFNLLFCSSGHDFLNSLTNLDPDLVYVDDILSDMKGIEVLNKAISMKPEIQMVIQSSHPDEEFFFGGLLSGAVGYHCVMDTDQFKFKNEIFLKGGSIITPTMAFRIKYYLSKKKIAVKNETDREILDMMTKGYTPEMIGLKRNLNFRKIHISVRNILKLLKNN